VLRIGGGPDRPKRGHSPEAAAGGWVEVGRRGKGGDGSSGAGEGRDGVATKGTVWNSAARRWNGSGACRRRGARSDDGRLRWWRAQRRLSWRWWRRVAEEWPSGFRPLCFGIGGGL
jgi:hypothetical protein